jgi:hypothetical protein
MTTASRTRSQRAGGIPTLGARIAASLTACATAAAVGAALLIAAPPANAVSETTAVPTSTELTAPADWNPAEAAAEHAQQSAAGTISSTVDDSTGAEQPKTDRPKTDQPKTDRPKTDKPKADKPKAEKPKADNPRRPKRPVGNDRAPREENPRDLQSATQTVTLPTPKPPSELPGGIEPLAPYQGQTICDPTPKPGALQLADLIRQTYGDLARSIWIPRACHIGGRSEHKEGRAVDWMINRRVQQQRLAAEAFIDWLLATDEDGNRFAMARRLGIMYIGWDDRIWESYRGGAWSELKGCFSKPNVSDDTYCHRDHIHISLTWDGASGLTSFWTGGTILDQFCDRTVTASRETHPVGNGLVFWPAKPHRALDTRSGLGVPAGKACRISQSFSGGVGAPIVLDATTLPGSPGQSVRAVAVRTITQGSNAPAQLRAHSTGAVIAPIAVNARSETVTVVPVGTDGTLAFSTDSGATHLIVDILGYFVRPAAATAEAGRWDLDQPRTVLNTALQEEPLQPGERRVITVVDPAITSARPSSAVVTVTVSDGVQSGQLIIRGGNDKRNAATPVVNYRRNDTVTQTFLVGLDREGTVTIVNRGKNTVNVNIGLQASSVQGGTVGALMVPVEPIEMTGEMTSLRRRLREAINARAVVIQVQASTTGAGSSVSFFTGSSDLDAPREPTVQVGRKSSLSTLVVVPIAEGAVIRRMVTGGETELSARIVGYLR